MRDCCFLKINDEDGVRGFDFVYWCHWEKVCVKLCVGVGIEWERDWLRLSLAARRRGPCKV